MNRYRSTTCGSISSVGSVVRLSGWCDTIRDHGGLLFIDLRDHRGIAQCVVDPKSPAFALAEKLRSEWVIMVDGVIRTRPAESVNTKLRSGHYEVYVTSIEVLGKSLELPMQVSGDQTYPEELRLKYRFLDLRREKVRQNILLRSDIIRSIRDLMDEAGFTEFQTPILTASSPEGARDYLVPSRVHPGKFYALPQAPQQFKQLLMIAGFDRYFQIAPCFRDEDARADRSPGEFYQLDIEMSFVTQEDIFLLVENLLGDIFDEFSLSEVDRVFPKITYADAMLKYGTDKPDLRNPLVITDVTEHFARDDVTFKAFKGIIEKGGIVRSIPAPGAAARPRSFFDSMNEWARGEGAGGLGYIQYTTVDGVLVGKGPIAKHLPPSVLTDIADAAGVSSGDALFFACDEPSKAAKLSGAARKRLGEQLELIDDDIFLFCWIVDFPMFEWNEEEKKIDFSHNPFSMPQYDLGSFLALDPLDTKAILDIKAFQYDIVCNGIELSSGAIRNHRPDIMKKAFEIAGYDEDVLRERFGGLYRALQYGAPPHGGIAPGIDRIVMLLAGEENLREIVAFPMNQKAEDLLMGAPSPVTAKQLKDLHIKVVEKPKG